MLVIMRAITLIVMFIITLIIMLIITLIIMFIITLIIMFIMTFIMTRVAGEEEAVGCCSRDGDGGGCGGVGQADCSKRVDAGAVT